MLVEAVRAAPVGDRDGTALERGEPAPGGAYEFTPTQNETIASLSRYMRLAGIVLVLFGVLQAVAAVLAARGGVGIAIQGIVSAVLGVLVISIAGHFRRIVDSRGRDIGHLMEALAQLRLMYAIQVWIVVVAIVLIGIVIAVAFVR